jgi:1,4-alpha-glucan branching enzyme
MVAKKEAKGTGARRQGAKKAEFSFMAPDAQSVQLAGDFNAWDPSVNPLKKSSKGVWKVNLKLSPGRYEYRFLVDGTWQNDPQCSAHVANPFGGKNCLIIVD